MNAFREMQLEIEDFFQTNFITKAILWLAVLLFPLYLTFTCNYLSYDSSEKLWLLFTENFGAFAYGLFLIYLIYAAFLCLFKRVPLAAWITGILFTVLPLIDYFKSTILEDHFYPWDMLLAKNADSFTTFLSSLDVPQSYWEVIGCTLFYLTFLSLTRPAIPRKPKFCIIGTPLLLGFVYLFLTNTQVRGLAEPFFGSAYKEPGDQMSYYEENGFLAAFGLNFGSLKFTAPAHYNEGYLEKMFAAYQPSADSGADFQEPDVIVVLSESFWDPTKLNGVSFSKDPLRNYRRIAEKHPAGTMVSCTFGGGTVRPEFEILTGMTTSMLPSGSVPYQQYVFEDIFSYARLFKEQGYDTLGVHTYQKTFYERDRVYPLMGFDDFLGEYDLHVPHEWNSGPYITDDCMVAEIMYQLEQPRENSLYLMAITMENHGLYYDKYETYDWDIKVSGDGLSERDLNILHNYAKGVSDSDRILGELYDYVMRREKPTVVLWYGDHLPTLGNDFRPYTVTGNISSTTASEWTDEEKYMMFSTPYVIFSNYDTGREYRAEGEAVSPYLLSPLLCDYIGAPECVRTNFLLDFYETCPVASPYYHFYSQKAEESVREEYIRLHELLTYDDLMGKKYLTSSADGAEQSE